VKLVDTSVWIEVFRARAPLDLERVVSFDEIVTCLPVIQEVLQGFRDEGAYRRARSSMLALPIVESPLAEDIVLEAVELYRTARRAGVTVRSSVDCLIAACAIRHDLEVVHSDRDYAALGRVSQLRHSGIRTASR
jgi:predicted nucleic acid-binding protein